jgi:hypothetical protein
MCETVLADARLDLLSSFGLRELSGTEPWTPINVLRGLANDELTRAALNTSGGAKSEFLSIKSSFLSV